MKIFLALIKIAVFFLALVVLTQNSGQYVNITLLNRTYENVDLLFVIIITLTIGTVLGGVFMAFLVIQERAERNKLKQKNRQLLQELESLRNVAIEEIPDEEFPQIAAPAAGAPQPKPSPVPEEKQPEQKQSEEIH